LGDSGTRAECAKSSEVPLPFIPSRQGRGRIRWNDEKTEKMKGRWKRIGVLAVGGKLNAES